MKLNEGRERRRKVPAQIEVDKCDYEGQDDNSELYMHAWNC